LLNLRILTSFKTENHEFLNYVCKHVNDKHCNTNTVRKATVNNTTTFISNNTYTRERLRTGYLCTSIRRLYSLFLKACGHYLGTELTKKLSQRSITVELRRVCQRPWKLVAQFTHKKLYSSIGRRLQAATDILRLRRR